MGRKSRHTYKRDTQKDRLILVAFCSLLIIVLWRFCWQAIGTAFNFSFEAFDVFPTVISLLIGNYEGSFINSLFSIHIPQVVLLILLLMFSPLIVGLYIGRHLAAPPYKTISVIILIFLTHFSLVVLKNTKSFQSFLISLLILVVICFIPLYCTLWFGFAIGRLIPSKKKGLHSLIASDISTKRKHSLIYLLVGISFFLISFADLQKNLNILSSSMLKVFNAPTRINAFPDDKPLFRVAISPEKSIKNTRDLITTLDWRKEINVRTGDTVLFVVYFNNSSLFYQAKSASISLQRKGDSGIYFATLKDRGQSLNCELAAAVYV